MTTHCQSPMTSAPSRRRRLARDYSGWVLRINHGVNMVLWFKATLRTLILLLLAMPLLFLAGCASAVQAGTNTALNDVDLVRMTDDMAQKIMASPAVQQAFARTGALSVVVQPVQNMMTGEVLPRGPAEAFSARVRVLLSKHAPDHFVWVMNRDSFNFLRSAELDADLGPAPDAIQPRYALVPEFHSLTTENSDRRSSAYLCTYQLSNLVDRTILWTGSYEVKKVSVKSFLD